MHGWTVQVAQRVSTAGTVHKCDHLSDDLLQLSTCCMWWSLQVTYAVHHLQQPYDDVLFTTLAKDIFHLNSTQPEARWVQNLDDAADVEAAQQKLAELLGT